MTEELKKEFSKLRFLDENGAMFPEWEEQKLGEVSNCLDSKRKPLNNVERRSISGNIPYYGSTSVQGYINDYIFDEELVLLGEDAAPFYEFREKPIAQYVNGKCWVNNHVHVLRAKEHAQFLFYSLVHKDVRKFVSSKTRGKLNQSDMVKIPINLPSLPEQEKIANFLSKIDEKIEAQAKLVELLKKQKQGYSQKIFNGSLRFKKDDGTDYDDWEEVKLGDVGKIEKGKQINRNTLSAFKTSKNIYPVLNGGISYSGWATEKNREGINISISEGGASAGFTQLVQQDFWSGGHNYTINQNSLSGLLISYLYQYLKHKEEDLMDSKVGSGLPNLQKPTLLNFKINLPSLPEQEKIAEFLSSLDNRIDEELNKLEKLKLAKQGYMQRVLG